MKPAKKTIRRKHQGAALIVSMIFVLVFSALAVSMATMSGTNLQIAENHRKADCARACAESGLEIIRFWLNRISISGTIEPELIFPQIAGALQSDLTANGISNINTSYDGSVITIPSVILDATAGQSFSAVMRQLDAETIQADITGVYGSITRTIRVDYKFGTRTNTVFDFGIATKGPLSLAGNIELEGINVSIESDVYIVSEDSLLALSIIGNSQIAGDVRIANPLATVDLQGGQASIGGETGEAALDHVFVGVDPPEFPTPDPGQFELYATSIVDSTTDTTVDATFENIKIAAGTNPDFTGSVTLNGIVFIETPNIVTFSGNTTITGFIIGNGSSDDNAGTNQINFLGNVDSYPVTELPSEPQFTEIKDQTGTFAMAPGFGLSFGGSFSTLNGAIAGNGISFFGNAGGTINGSIINYSDTDMELSGNSDLYFNRSGTVQMPAGFVPEIILQYVPASYSEIVL